MTWHELKTWPDPFTAVVGGQKTHEVRRFDRPFAVGDFLLLREYLPDLALEAYSGRRVVVEVTHVTGPGTWGLPADVGVMSIRLVRVLLCDLCRKVFVGPERETCPKCGHRARWSATPMPGYRFWNEEPRA